MGRVFIISDPHFDNNNIIKFSGDYRSGDTSREHDEWLIKQWNSVVTKRDMVWVLGDIFFSKDLEYFDYCFNSLLGEKKLVMGNHDQLKTEQYLRHFNKIYGIVRYRQTWLSHAPVHPLQLRGMKNCHGHVHHKTIEDNNYINCCVEACNGVPIPFDDILNGSYSTGDLK